MTHGKHQKHSQAVCNRIAALRKQGLTWSVISQRMGICDRSCRYLIERAR